MAGIAVKVRYLAVLKGLAGDGDRSVLLEEKTLGSLFSRLRDAESESLKARLFGADGKVRPDILILVNGVDSGLLGGMDAELKDGDEVALLPSVHGG